MKLSVMVNGSKSFSTKPHVQKKMAPMIQCFLKAIPLVNLPYSNEDHLLRMDRTRSIPQQSSPSFPTLPSKILPTRPSSKTWACRCKHVHWPCCTGDILFLYFFVYQLQILCFVAKICSGQGCLISGPSGCGKSSILRVIGRLWPAATGSVNIPQHVGPDGVFFLPQRKLARMK